MAIELPEDIRAMLQPAIDGLELLGDAVRVNSVDRIHLTLHFLGQIPAGHVRTLQRLLSSSLAGQQSFELVAQGVGAFPNFGRPQVLWAGIGGDGLPALTTMQAAMGNALRSTGIVLEDRFHPHLTLARVRRPIGGPERKPLRDWQARWREARFGMVPVESVTLFRSELGAGRPRYSPIDRFELQ